MKNKLSFSIFFVMLFMISVGKIQAQQELLSGTNMEDVSQWNVSLLNTIETGGTEADVTWNYTLDAPTNGSGGNLYVTGTANNSSVHYCIWQPVHLSADSIYYFDGAYKALQINNSWCEVFIGTESPIDGADYGEGQTNIANFGTWSAVDNLDGTFAADANGPKEFVPTETGDYFFVIKMGSTSWDGTDQTFEMMIDELSLTRNRVAPITKFSAQPTVGFVPLSVQFTDESNYASSWEWDFGDGSALSSDQNPLHVFDAVGTYTVTLTATNEIGSSVLVKSDYIKVNELPDLPENEKLYGGNMENPNFWNITQLNANADTDATWNYTTNVPAQGEGGCLNITASVVNATSQYCIWQAVELKADSVYNFDAAFRDMTGVDHFWSEVFIGNVAPVDGEDYSSDIDGVDIIAYFNTWEACTGNMLDGLYSEGACAGDNGIVGQYKPATDGTYYFVMKTGTTDWEGVTYSFDVLIDEVSLLETTYVAAPVADFFADVTSGDAPLTVNFTDLSDNTTSWSWDFGDGGTSTDQHPSHTYQAGGVYTVSLTATNGSTSDTYTATDLITVSGSSSVNDLSADEICVYPQPSSGNVTIDFNGTKLNTFKVYDITGKETVCSILSSGQGKLQIRVSGKGVYFIQINTDKGLLTKKIVIR